MTLKELLPRYLKSRGISKNELIRSLGYKNMGKACNRLEQFLNFGKCKNPEIIEKIRLLLDIPQDDYNQAIDGTQYASKSHERSIFKPHIVILWERCPGPTFVVAMFSSSWHFQVPDHVTELPLEREFEEVRKIYREQCKNKDNMYVDSDLYTRFRYYRTYDEWVDFHRNGEVLEAGSRHAPGPKAFLTVSGRKIPPSFFGG